MWSEGGFTEAVGDAVLLGPTSEVVLGFVVASPLVLLNMFAAAMVLAFFFRLSVSRLPPLAAASAMGYGFSCFEPLTLCEQWYRRGVLPDKGGLLTRVKVQSSRVGWRFLGNMLRASGTQPGVCNESSLHARDAQTTSGCLSVFERITNGAAHLHSATPLLSHSLRKAPLPLATTFFQILLGVVQVLDDGKTRGSVRPVPVPSRVFQRRSRGQG